MSSPFDGFTVHPVGSAPLIAAMCDEIDLPEIVNNMVKWDPKQCRTSPGVLIKSLVINVLSGRTALYKVAEYYEEQDLEILFGPGIEADCFNDDALGRALDKLSYVHPKRVYSALALSALTKHKIEPVSLHADTTSYSVYGEYETEGDLDITYGYSKDHRPDLKQFLYGLIVTNEGVPLYGEVRNGNLSDKTWNQEILDKLHEILPTVNTGNIYIADSAMITKENLKIMQSQGVKFISRLPETYGLAEEVKEWAWTQNRWIEMGVLSKKPKAARYRAQSTIRELYGHKYRFIVFQSTSLDARKEKTIAKQIDKEYKELEKACQDVSKRTFYCQADAEKELQLFISGHKNILHSLTGKAEETVTLKRSVGRPKKGVEPETETAYRVTIDIQAPSAEEIADLRAKASTFILVTNVLEEKQLSAINVLKEYKEQTAVEVRFRFLKDPGFIDGIYLKNPERVLALGYIFLMALLVYALLERRVRRNLKTEKEPLILLGKRKSANPTGVSILEMLESIQIARIVEKNQIFRKVPKNLINPQIRRVLRLAGFDEYIYVEPKRNSQISL